MSFSLNAKKIRLENYAMKMQLYPSPAQAEQMDKMFLALRLAYNMTFHEVFQQNPAVCGDPDEDGNVWPSYKKMANKTWRKALIDQTRPLPRPPQLRSPPIMACFCLMGKRPGKPGCTIFRPTKPTERTFGSTACQSPGAVLRSRYRPTVSFHQTPIKRSPGSSCRK